MKGKPTLLIYQSPACFTDPLIILTAVHPSGDDEGLEWLKQLVTEVISMNDLDEIETTREALQHLHEKWLAELHRHVFAFKTRNFVSKTRNLVFKMSSTGTSCTRESRCWFEF